MSADRGKTHTLHLSLVRPVLFGGAEQGVAVVTFMAAVGIPLFGGLHFVTVAVALAFAFPVHALGVWIARRDPQMVAVYLRSLSGRDYYLPFDARRHPSPPRVRPSIPGAA